MWTHRCRRLAAGAAAATAAAAAAGASASAARCRPEDFDALRGRLQLTPPAPFSLRGKVALVTGAAEGTMGGAIAEQLAAQGADVVCVDIPLPDREASLLALTKSIAARHSVRVVAIPADVTDVASVEALFVQAKESLGRVDIAVATVGGGGFVDGKLSYANQLPAHEEPWETTLRTITTTQFSAHHTAKVAARSMIAAGEGGRIVLVGSIMAEMAAETSSAYTSSKCAVKKLGEIMAHELAPHRITVNTVQPGHIATAAELAMGMTPLQCELQGKRIPAGRMGKPSDIGTAVGFLVSDEAEYITGTTVDVDGGWKLCLALPGEFPGADARRPDAAVKQ
jgi:NAD(P)-dependent dehydrogenase (short-subunit alcohol dehydrogenase family)